MLPLADNKIESNLSWKTIATKFQTLQTILINASITSIKILAFYTMVYKQPNPAVFGFAIGFIFTDKVMEVSRKVDRVFDSCKTSWEKISVIGVCGFNAFLTLPASFILATIYISATLGAHLDHSSKERYQRYQANE
ncbi:MAG: hypothetical protein H0W88_10740 [Parachlamydiaceae bacterium]|nr:hypothetical protein [Parachlamydiaceae bacterium]